MKIFLFSTIVLALMLGACSPAGITPVSSSGEQPTPIVEVQPVTMEPSVTFTEGYQSVQISDVSVEVGQGSPLPVFVNVSGRLLDQCGQVDLVEIIQYANFFDIYIGTFPAPGGTCIEDTMPFRMKIPLSVVNLPAGSYNVQVNSIPAEFQLGSGSSTAELLTRETPMVREEIQVDDITLEMGTGSQQPIQVIVSANLPNSCAQLGEIRIVRSELNAYSLSLIAFTPEGATNCTPDTLPIRLEIPLNSFSFEEGTYQVVAANGTSASFTVPIPQQ